MASVTVIKTFGTTGTFSTPQLWEDGKPADLTTSEQSAAGTFAVASFMQGEALTFVGSGAVGAFLHTDSTGPGTGTFITYSLISGNPAASDVATGGMSTGTCILSSGTADFVGVVWQGQSQNQEFSGTGTRLTIEGSTTSTTAYTECTTVAGASFRDHVNVQTNALRYNAANGCGMTASNDNALTVVIGEAYSRLLGMQVSATGSGGRGVSVTNGGILVNHCIVEAFYAGASTSSGVLNAGGAFTCANTVIIQRASAADHIVSTGTHNPSLYNCTIVAPDDLATAPTSIFLSGASGTVTVQNCGLFAGDSTKAIKVGTATFNFTTCYSDISGTAGVTQTTYGNEFQNVLSSERDFRLKTGAAQIDTGTMDAVNAAIDIAKTNRPSGPLYDVGAWEFITLPLPVPGDDDGDFFLITQAAA
jgi:hypothetical protein